jgi:hypothetical protein
VALCPSPDGWVVPTKRDAKKKNKEGEGGGGKQDPAGAGEAAPAAAELDPEKAAKKVGRKSITGWKTDVCVHRCMLCQALGVQYLNLCSTAACIPAH